MPFLQTGSSCFLFFFFFFSYFLLIVETDPCELGWTKGFSRFPGWGSLCLCSGGWSWISFLECNGVSSSKLWDVYWFVMSLGSLSFNVQGCVPVLLDNQCAVSCTETFWLLYRAWFQGRYGDFWVSYCLLIFPGIKSSLMF